MSTTTLRPNADASTALSQFGSGTGNYGRVNEASADDSNGVYIWMSGTPLQDVYGLPDPSLAGTITDVTVYARCWRATGSYEIAQGCANLGVRVNSKNYLSAAKALNTTATQISQSWAQNPNTKAAWTWANINDLQAILSLAMGTWSDGKNAGSFNTYCSQLWVVITYTEPTSFIRQIMKTHYFPPLGGGN